MRTIQYRQSQGFVKAPIFFSSSYICRKLSMFLLEAAVVNTSDF